MVITFRNIIVLLSFPWVFDLDVNLSFMISAYLCLLEFPRKLPRAKPCSDPNRVREPGEVEFDIEVGACPVFSLLLILVIETEGGYCHSICGRGWGEIPVYSMATVFIK